MPAPSPGPFRRPDPSGPAAALCGVGDRRDLVARPKVGFHDEHWMQYIPPGDRGFWRGTFRDPTDPAFAAAADVIARRGQFTVDILYGDAEGGQRMISRFSVFPIADRDEMLATAVHHWNLDRPDPR